MGYLSFHQYWGNGFSWLNRGYEYTLLWGLVSLAIALRGGGIFLRGGGVVAFVVGALRAGGGSARCA